MSVRALIASLRDPEEIDFEERVWTSLDEIEPDGDYDGSLDGDDSLLAAPHAAGQHALASRSTGVATAPKRKRKAKIVIFVEPIKLGEKGFHVIALKRALARVRDATGKPFLRWTQFDPVMNKRTLKALNRFLSASIVTGPAGKKWHVAAMPHRNVYDLGAHRKLARWYDPYSAFLLAKARKVEAAEDAEVHARALAAAKVRNGQAAMILTYNKRWDIHYTQGQSRMSGIRGRLRPPRYGRWEDCSSEATWVLWVAAYPDPNHFGFAGYGFTGTMVPHGEHIESVRSAKPLDLFFFGRAVYATSHVATAFHKPKGGKMILHSQGSEAGPLFLVYDYRHDRVAIRRYVA